MMRNNFYALIAFLVLLLTVIHGLGLQPAVERFVATVLHVPRFEGPNAGWFNVGFNLLYLAVLVYILKILFGGGHRD